MNAPESKWKQVSLPKALVVRVDAVFADRGFNSRAEYIRVQLIRAVDKDEELVREG